MAPEITAEHDAATETIEALAAFSGLDRATVVSRLAQETAAMRLHGVETLFPRWIRRPLDAMPVFEDVHRRVAIALYEVRRELKRVEGELVSLREEGWDADADALSKQAARLLCREADLRERVESRDEDLLAAARDGITRILDVTLRSLAKATAKFAREAKAAGPPQMRRALAHVEAYERLVREAQSVTGGVVDVPRFRVDFVEALRRKVGRKGTTSVGASQKPLTV
ncbi:MAG TPA: hypothetical protein VLI67_12170 [Vicinamibacteria bacterium]|nr:hypothetical protein [Vicinamibacteria bacterium]